MRRLQPPFNARETTLLARLVSGISDQARIEAEGRIVGRPKPAPAAPAEPTAQPSAPAR